MAGEASERRDGRRPRYDPRMRRPLLVLALPVLLLVPSLACDSDGGDGDGGGDNGDILELMGDPARESAEYAGRAAFPRSGL